jgi:hypothetical protein
MSNPYDEDRLIVSEELNDRLSHLLEDTQNVWRESIVVLIAKSGEAELNFVGWDQRDSSIQVELLEMADAAIVEELARASNLCVRFFGQELKVLSTSAKRKNGRWLVSLFLDDI